MPRVAVAPTVVVGVGPRGRRAAVCFKRLVEGDDVHMPWAHSLAASLSDPAIGEALSGLLSERVLDAIERQGFEVSGRRAGAIDHQVIWIMDCDAVLGDSGGGEFREALQVAILIGSGAPGAVLEAGAVSAKHADLVIPVAAQDRIGARSDETLVGTAARFAIVIASGQLNLLDLMGAPRRPMHPISRPHAVRAGMAWCQQVPRDRFALLAAAGLLEEQFRRGVQPTPARPNGTARQLSERLSPKRLSGRLLATIPASARGDRPIRVALNPGQITAELSDLAPVQWSSVILRLRDFLGATRLARWADAIAMNASQLVAELSECAKRDRMECHRVRHGPAVVEDWTADVKMTIEALPEFQPTAPACDDVEVAARHLAAVAVNTPAPLSYWVTAVVLAAGASTLIGTGVFLAGGTALALAVAALTLGVIAGAAAHGWTRAERELAAARTGAVESLLADAERNLACSLTVADGDVRRAATDLLEQVRLEEQQLAVGAAESVRRFRLWNSEDEDDVFEVAVPVSLQEDYLRHVLGRPWAELLDRPARDGLLVPRATPEGLLAGVPEDAIHAYASAMVRGLQRELSFEAQLGFRHSRLGGTADDLVASLFRKAALLVPKPTAATVWFGPQKVLAAAEPKARTFDYNAQFVPFDVGFVACLRVASEP